MVKFDEKGKIILSSASYKPDRDKIPKIDVVGITCRQPLEKKMTRFTDGGKGIITIREGTPEWEEEKKRGVRNI